MVTSGVDPSIDAMVQGLSPQSSMITLDNARRARERVPPLLGICGLVLALCGSLPTPVRGQAVTTDRSTMMTKVKTPRVARETPAARATTETNDIRPFKVHVSDSALADLRRRIRDTRWPERETVTDDSQGVPLALMQELVRHWGTDYDWRKVEAKLNALPQFVTNIDGLDIHFIYVKSKEKNALPLLISHGWPGSIIEQLKIIDPLTNPTAYGASASDAFDVVIPSMPGYGFSGKPTNTGWGPERMAKAWAELMRRLGYTRYVAQGGDWGAFVVDFMGVQAPPGLLAIHTNMPGTVPAEIDKQPSPATRRHPA